MFISWPMYVELLLFVIGGITAIAFILSKGYKTISKEDQIISPRAKLRYLFFSFVAFVLAGGILIYLTMGNELAFAISILCLGVVFALLQYFSTGIGSILASWAIWLPGTAGIIVYFNRILTAVSALFNELGPTAIMEPSVMQVLSTTGVALGSAFVLVFLGGIAFFGVEANTLWQRTDYTIRSKRILMFAMALGLLLFTIMLARWVLHPMFNIILQLLRLITG